MRYGSVCSGIEAATVAWEPLGFRPAFFAEIDRFPSKVLAHHYPDVPNAGDFTTIQGDEYGRIDTLVGGTPCQDFSVAGLRAGLDGARGQLTIEFAALAHRLAARARTRWLVWENVPGVLSIDDGRAFALFLSALTKRTVRVPDGGWQNAGIIPGAADGFGLAYRVLDAQFAGVPQRRRRVFVVGHLGDWRRAAAVLFERHSLSGHPAPRREKGQTAPTVPSRRTGGGGLGTDFDCGLVASTADWPADVAQTLDCHYGDKMGLEDQHINGGGSLFVPVGGFPDQFEGHFDRESYEESGRLVPIAYRTSPNCGAWETGDRTDALTTGTDRTSTVVATKMAVRRLTPRECERLQGFPDDYTRIGPATADGPRYKALGNSMAVPVMRWIGERIKAVDAIPTHYKMIRGEPVSFSPGVVMGMEFLEHRT